MWSNYALSLYRTLSRHKLYAALNTLGLALGLAVCATLLIVVRFETSFDSWVPHAERIFRLNKVNTFPGRPVEEHANSQAVLLPALLADFPQQIEAAVRLWDDQVIVRKGDQPVLAPLVLADPGVFEMFGLKALSGDLRTSLNDLNSLVITRSQARRLLGTDRAVGRELHVILDGVPRIYRVTAVIEDPPPNSHLGLGLIARFAKEAAPNENYLDRWGSSFLYTYVKLRRASDAPVLEAALRPFIARHAHDPGDGDYTSAMFHYDLDPLRRIHFTDARIGAAFKPGTDPVFVAALGVMGVVTLLVAIVNYVSLATARAGLRAREVAVRKVMGATRRALVAQFVAESVVMAFAAGLIALALVELTLPGVSAMLGEPITLHYLGADGALLPLAALCLAVGLIAGFYPALALSGFRPAAVLASARTPGGGRAGARVREVMAVGQFAAAIALMACTTVVFAQIQFLRSADLGFKRDGLIIVRNIGDPQVAQHMRTLVETFRQTPGVISATASDRRPGGDDDNNSNVHLLSNPKVQPTLTFERIGPDYVKTYGLRVIAGRGLGLQQRLDDRAGVKIDNLKDKGGLNIMINESAAHALGFPRAADAVGQRMGPGATGDILFTIVGVVANVRYVSPRVEPPPQVYMQDSTLTTPERAGPWSAAVRVRAEDIPTVTRRLESVWRSLSPDSPFRSETVEVALKPYYDADARRGQLFAVGSGLSAAIACLGLYGLAAFNTSRRTKEIGIRKTLGASTADVLRLLIGEFLRPVLWANVIAWPAAWLVMRAWLAGFDQRIELNPLYFLAPTIVGVVVAVGTVADQAFRVARAEPARALRYE